MTATSRPDAAPLPPEHLVGVVVGSTRPSRICADIADWALDLLQNGSELDYQLVDLAEINLPFLDEPLKPAVGNYEHEHTRKWSRLVSSFDALVFVSPQYKGLPGAAQECS